MTTNDELRATEQGKHEARKQVEQDLVVEHGIRLAYDQSEAYERHAAAHRSALGVDKGLVLSGDSHPAALLVVEASTDAARQELAHAESMARHWERIMGMLEGMRPEAVRP